MHLMCYPENFPSAAQPAITGSCQPRYCRLEGRHLSDNHRMCSIARYGLVCPCGGLCPARSCFAYGGHAVFPGILRVMRQPTEFPAALTVAFVLISCVYVLPSGPPAPGGSQPDWLRCKSAAKKKRVVGNCPAQDTPVISRARPPKARLLLHRQDSLVLSICI